MTSPPSDQPTIVIRTLQYRDLEAVETLAVLCYEEDGEGDLSRCIDILGKQWQQIRSWYGFWKFLSFFSHPERQDYRIYVALQEQQLVGFIQVSPFNNTRSTWRVDRIITNDRHPQKELLVGRRSIGSQLMRYCLERVWEARTWIVEVNTGDEKNLALYRQNGFQPLAHMTYWSITAESLAQVAAENADLPNLLPIGNADAQLLYQLDCVSMPPLLRQVFDRHIKDFQSGSIKKLFSRLSNWLNRQEIIEGYVFETQRKAAIAYFCLEKSLDDTRPHQARLNVHPAYTWLYPKLLGQMAFHLQNASSQTLELASADYQSEREEYLTEIGAQQIKHTLLMSRSVWHKLRETKPLEGLQLAEMLQGLQPVSRPVPTRLPWLSSSVDSLPSDRNSIQTDEETLKGID
jgi:ribosomal protein S18 acetylase RimI-like enzyme